MNGKLQWMVLIGLSCGASWAQFSPDLNRCMDKAAAQPEIDACAAAEGQRADAAMNNTFQLLMTALKDDSGATKKVRDAQKAWTAFKEAALDARFPAKDKRREYGSIFPTEYDLFRAKLTYRQVDTLKDLLDHSTK